MLSARRLVMLLLAATLLLAGCSGHAPQFVASETNYDKTSALTRLESADPGWLTSQKADDAESLRHDALVALRKQGDVEAKAADLLTSTFPADTKAVPFYVEKAQYASEPAYVVVESLGKPGGPLSDKRLWVLGETGDVLLSATR